MNTLLDTLLSIRHDKYDIVKPELIQGYTISEIKYIEKRYNLSIHGQFKDFLMTMGKCSGGILHGDEIYIERELCKSSS